MATNKSNAMLHRREEKPRQTAKRWTDGIKVNLKNMGRRMPNITNNGLHTLQPNITTNRDIYKHCPGHYHYYHYFFIFYNYYYYFFNF